MSHQPPPLPRPGGAGGMKDGQQTSCGRCDFLRSSEMFFFFLRLGPEQMDRDRGDVGHI